MRALRSLLLFVVVVVLAFAVGVVSRVTLDRSPQPADRGASPNPAPSATASAEHFEPTDLSLRLKARSGRGSERARARVADQSASGNRPRIHTVRPGESLWEIASRQVGDGATNAVIARMVKRLAARNAGRIDDSGLLKTGQRLRLAKPARTVKTSGERSAGSSTRIYTVKAGESLWQIAERLLGQDATVAEVARRVKRLSATNSGRFNDPDLLRPGQKLRLR